jgi:putative ABC transport system substrate-binding protein
MKRGEFIAGLGGAAAAWPLAARAQQPALPVVGFVNPGSADTAAGGRAAFRKVLGETGYVEGRNVTVEYHFLDGRYDRLSAVMADLVRRRVAVIVTSPPPRSWPKPRPPRSRSCSPSGGDPVKLGLVKSLARPGGNATGINFFAAEVLGKRLGLLHDLLPKAVRVAVLVNPTDVTDTETISRDVQEAALLLHAARRTDHHRRGHSGGLAGSEQRRAGTAGTRLRFRVGAVLYQPFPGRRRICPEGEFPSSRETVP